MWGILAAVIFSQIIGTIWYSPFFLGKPWLNNNFPGKTADQIGREGNFQMALVATVVSQTCLSLIVHYVLLSYLGITCVYTALKIAFGLAAIFTASDIPHLVFSIRPFVVFIIDHLYDAAVFASICVSVVYFK